MNKHTDDDLSFFLIEVHAYKIGDSDPAPQFKVIEQPNDFAKSVKAISQNSSLNDSQRSRLEFWTQFNEVLEERGKPFNKRKPSTDHWYSVATGTSGCHINIDLVNKENKIRVNFCIVDNKDLYDKIYVHKDDIESACGFALEWHRLNGKKASFACTYIYGLDFDNHENYPELMNKAIDLVLTFKKAFVPFLK